MAVSIEATSGPDFGLLEHQPAQSYLCLCDREGLKELVEFFAREGSAGKAIDICCFSDGSMDKVSSEERAIFYKIEERDAVCGAKFSALSMANHIFLCGRSSFITAVYASALSHGVAKDAITLRCCGEASRRIQCVHCKTIYPHVSGRLYHCNECNIELVVRDHFSQRLGAYQAAMILASDPDYQAIKQGELT